VAFTPIGIVIALIFVGLPFIVRTVQPVMEEIDREVEEASATLGATRWQTISRVLLPGLAPAILTGFALAFARGIGEYGSVIFIAGNIPSLTEIAPLSSSRNITTPVPPPSPRSCWSYHSQCCW
jgi:sulfate/thiosulfate transport system permease protein